MNDSMKESSELGRQIEFLEKQKQDLMKEKQDLMKEKQDLPREFVENEKQALMKEKQDLMKEIQDLEKQDDIPQGICSLCECPEYTISIEGNNRLILFKVNRWTLRILWSQTGKTRSCLILFKIKQVPPVLLFLLFVLVQIRLYTPFRIHCNL